MKEYHISFFDDDIILTKDISRRGVDYMFEDIDNAWKKRYTIEIGSKIVDIFGNVVTIKEIIHHESTKTTNYLIEENGNCYQPSEFAGHYVKHLSKDEFDKLIG